MNKELIAFDALLAISSVDGRYHSATQVLSQYLSEYGLIRARVLVEVRYLQALSRERIIRKFTDIENDILNKIANIDLSNASIIKQIEREGYVNIPATNHDVKAVEYYIKLKLADTSLADISEWTHFALTSEDTNSVAYAICLAGAITILSDDYLSNIGTQLNAWAMQYSDMPMLARTHGQPATPTTFGREMRVFEQRLVKQIAQLKSMALSVKFGGATGSWNAHHVALPNVDWLQFAQKFVQDISIEAGNNSIELNAITTQIEPHDTYAEMSDNIRRINTILIGFSQDIWRYISDGWIVQKINDGEVGSSTMPHKINPIDYENAEGNLGVSNALFEHFSRKLPISRLQRDLSDSTVERVFGTAFAHAIVGYSSLMRGFAKSSINKNSMMQSLTLSPQVITEAIQTVMRAEGAHDAYEKLKEFSRGRDIALQDLRLFIQTLQISDDAKQRLLALAPETYLGIAKQIARNICVAKIA